ncbi:MAG: hypothetical protein Q9227_009046 [Pyrenula ochraceoflavens]
MLQGQAVDGIKKNVRIVCGMDDIVPSDDGQWWVDETWPVIDETDSEKHEYMHINDKVEGETTEMIMRDARALALLGRGKQEVNARIYLGDNYFSGPTQPNPDRRELFTILKEGLNKRPLCNFLRYIKPRSTTMLHDKTSQSSERIKASLTMYTVVPLEKPPDKPTNDPRNGLMKDWVCGVPHLRDIDGAWGPDLSSKLKARGGDHMRNVDNFMYAAFSIALKIQIDGNSNSHKEVLPWQFMGLRRSDLRAPSSAMYNLLFDFEFYRMKYPERYGLEEDKKKYPELYYLGSYGESIATSYENYMKRQGKSPDKGPEIEFAQPPQKSLPVRSCQGGSCSARKSRKGKLTRRKTRRDTTAVDNWNRAGFEGPESQALVCPTEIITSKDEIFQNEFDSDFERVTQGSPAVDQDPLPAVGGSDNPPQSSVGAYQPSHPTSSTASQPAQATTTTAPTCDDE